MSYSTIATMAQDGDLQQRFTGCAAQELGPTDDPQAWVLNNIWALVAAPGLADSYQYAVDTATINQNPRIGQRDDVISDVAILATVQARIAELAP